MKTYRRSVVCPNPQCGGTFYHKTFDYTNGYLNAPPVWECSNCLALTPRAKRHNKTNFAKALDAYRRLKSLWEPVDAELNALIARGIPNGCLLVYASTFNSHMDKLLTREKLSRWELRYHIEQATADLEKAKEFIGTKQVELASR